MAGKPIGKGTPRFANEPRPCEVRRKIATPRRGSSQPPESINAERGRLRMITKFRAACAALVAVMLLSGTAGAQKAGPSIDRLRREQEMARRVPVTIALSDQLPAPDSVPALI